MFKAAKRLLPALLLMVMLLLTVAAAGACSATDKADDTTDKTELRLTHEALAQFDGLEGRRAYIAVDGVIYDVTEHAQWKDGLHHDRFQAGQDYSDEIRSLSPHGTKMLDRVPQVGVLID